MSELKPLYPENISEFIGPSDGAPTTGISARAERAWRAAVDERMATGLRDTRHRQNLFADPDSVADLPTLAPQHPPADRRIQHNNALRTTVIMGDLLAQRLRLKVADTVDFESEGLIAAWQNAVARLRSFGK